MPQSFGATIPASVRCRGDLSVGDAGLPADSVHETLDKLMAACCLLRHARLHLKQKHLSDDGRIAPIPVGHVAQTIH